MKVVGIGASLSWLKWQVQGGESRGAGTVPSEEAHLLHGLLQGEIRDECEGQPRPFHIDAQSLRHLPLMVVLRGFEPHPRTTAETIHLLMSYLLQTIGYSTNLS